MNLNGDLFHLPRRWFGVYPIAARSNQGPAWVYTSIGITQVKWLPDNSVNIGTRFLRWKSTAFDLDFMAAEIRFYYDGKCTWCHPHYHAGNRWMSMAAWNSPAPWRNNKQKWYAGRVQEDLRLRPWASPSFPTSVVQRH